MLYEEDTIVLSDLSAVMVHDGESGNNMIREFDTGLTVNMQRPIRDLLQCLPRFQVSMPVTLPLSIFQSLLGPACVCETSPKMRHLAWNSR